MLREIKNPHGGDVYTLEEDVIDFSSNLNPFGMHPDVKKAIIDNVDKYDIYPDPNQREVKKALGEVFNIDENYITVGNGAADIIFRLALLFRNKDAVVVQPTFSEYEDALILAGARIRKVFLKEKYGFAFTKDTLEEIKGKGDIIFICSPNNPTGLVIDRKYIMELLEDAKLRGAILFVDSCFAGFVEGDIGLEGLINEYPNLFILRAFTKIHAMAGLRLGYGISSNLELIEKINTMLQTWPVSTVAQVAGLAALKSTPKEDVKIFVAKEREFLTNELVKKGLVTYPSKANYIFFRGEKGLKEKFLQEKILIRSCENYPGLDERYYRIAVRNEAENKAFVGALEKIFR